MNIETEILQYIVDYNTKKKHLPDIKDIVTKFNINNDQAFFILSELYRNNIIRYKAFNYITNDSIIKDIRIFRSKLWKEIVYWKGDIKGLIIIIILCWLILKI